jgi:hypothetical protein
MESQQLSYCAVAAIFIGASIYTMMTCKKCSPFLEFETSLTPQQKHMHSQIIKERERIYLSGLILGTLLAFVYLYGYGLSMNPLKSSCVFVAIALATQYIYYMLAPKSQYMVTEMNNKDQLEKWLAVYKHMQYRYHFGMVLGLIGYFLFAYGFQLK